jgi:hypothetical protein
MRHQDQFVAMAVSHPGDGYKHKSGLITDEAGAMEWATSKVQEMRAEGAASPIREVTVRDWGDKGSGQLKYRCPDDQIDL